MKRKQKRARQNLKKQIASAPDGNKMLVAYFGKDLTKLERNARLYLEIPNLAKTYPLDFVKSLRDVLLHELMFEFLTVLENGDGKALRHLADTLDSVIDRDPVDSLRSKILVLKANMSEGQKLKLSELAKRINYRGSDLTVLRRIAKELEFPIQRGEVGRPKNSD